jgi:hypothetical protein
MPADTGNLFFRPEELGFFDSINAEAQRLTSPRGKYYLKILPPVTQDESRFQRDVLYGEQKKNWKFAGPLIMPVHMQTPDEPKEFEENKGGNQDMSATAYISRKLFEETIPEDIANVLIAARGSIIPDAGDVIAIWTTHQGDVAFWDVESLERDQFLGDLPLHLQWRINLQRRSRYEAERQFGADLTMGEPIVIIDAEDYDFHERTEKLKPQVPAEGKLYPLPPTVHHAPEAERKTLYRVKSTDQPNPPHTI